MTRIIYRTATSLTGYIADDEHSLGWLFDVDHEVVDGHDEFLGTLNVIVEGSSTYEWVLRETDMLAQPTKWQQFYGSRHTFVFTWRDLPTPEGADVRFLQGRVADHVPEILAAAQHKNIWVVGGGDLEGQFVQSVYAVGRPDRAAS